MTNVGMDFRSGSATNVFPVRTPPSSNIRRLMKEPEKGEL